jgi:sarcosine oxidase
MSEQPDVIVVGAGLLGLSAARALASRGRAVTVLERAEVGHLAGSSHGSCRIFRLGYGDPDYVVLARQAADLWQAAEAQAGAQFLYPVPQLTFGDQLGAVQAAMQAAGRPGELLPAAEVAARYPAVSTGGPALLEHGSSVIAADQVLRALAAAPGPRVRTGVRVRALRDDGRRVTVSTDGGQFTAPVVIVTAGPWTSELLGPAGLRVPASSTLEQVAFLAPADRGPDDPGRGGPGAAQPGPAQPSAAQPSAAQPSAAQPSAAAPIFICHGVQSPYGLPVPGSSLYKIGIHPSGRPVDPDHQDRSISGAERQRLIRLARRYLPGMNPSPVRFEQCIYDNSPDEDFVVDRIGNVVIGSGTSGHGFKFGPLFGEWLTGLAINEPRAAPPGRFALRRFR